MTSSCDSLDSSFNILDTDSSIRIFNTLKKESPSDAIFYDLMSCMQQGNSQISNHFPLLSGLVKGDRLIDDVKARHGGFSDASEVMISGFSNRVRHQSSAYKNNKKAIKMSQEEREQSSAESANLASRMFEASKQLEKDGYQPPKSIQVGSDFKKSIFSNKITTISDTNSYSKVLEDNSKPIASSVVDQSPAKSESTEPTDNGNWNNSLFSPTPNSGNSFSNSDIPSVNDIGSHVKEDTELNSRIQALEKELATREDKIKSDLNGKEETSEIKDDPRMAEILKELAILKEKSELKDKYIKELQKEKRSLKVLLPILQ